MAKKNAAYFTGEGWVDERCKTIDFGTTEQLIPAVFYTWLTANATQVQDDVITNIKINITENGKTTLLTAGKYCDRNVEVVVDVPNTAIDPVLEELTATENGTYAPGDGIDGYSSVTVNVAADTSNEDGLVTRTLTTYTNDRVTTIGMYAFRQAPNLKEVYFPNVTLVDGGAFMNCTTLEKAEFDNVTRFKSYAFSSCTGLNCLIIRTGSVAQLDAASCIQETGVANGTGFVYVPDDLVERYQTATNWVTHASQIKPISELEKTMIRFTIDGASYQAEEGMTWGEWVESDYNNGNFVVNSSNIYQGNKFVGTSSAAMAPLDVIIEGYAYVLM